MSDPAEMDKLMTEKEYEEYLKSIEWGIYMKVVFAFKVVYSYSFRFFSLFFNIWLNFSSFKIQMLVQEFYCKWNLNVLAN